MRTLMAALALGCFFSLAGMAVAGPFGTEMGQKPDQFTNLERVEISGPLEKVFSLYITDTLPKMNPLFQKYHLIFGKDGLARIDASSETYKDDAYGVHVRNSYDIIKKQLIKKYGEPKSYDFLRKDSIWTREKDFVIGLYKGERHLSSIWKTNLPDNISRILLLVHGNSPEESYLSLAYEYKNYDEIQKKIDEVKKKLKEMREKIGEDAL